MTNDAPLSKDEFNELARTGHLSLPLDRDNVAIHDYLYRVRGWSNVRTLRVDTGDDDAHIEIDAIFD